MKEKKLFKRLAEEINLILRGAQGHGAGHPWKPRKITPPLGKSEVERYVDAVDAPDEVIKLPKKVKVSKAFKNKRE